MTKIGINGDIDEACVKLKAILDAQDDKFKANLAAMSKSNPSPHTPAAAERNGCSRSVKQDYYAGSPRIRLRT